jgi:nitroreductase
MWAPSRLNRRPWHFIVIRDTVLLKKLANLLRIHPYLETAPAAVAVCAEPQRSPTWLMDVSAAIENLLIGATAVGLGSAWIGSPDTVMWNLCEELLHDVLVIPPDVRVPALIAIGYPDPDAPLHERQERYDPNRIHSGIWDNRLSTVHKDSGDHRPA